MNCPKVYTASHTILNLDLNPKCLNNHHTSYTNFDQSIPTTNKHIFTSCVYATFPMYAYNIFAKNNIATSILTKTHNLYTQTVRQNDCCK